MIYCKDTDKLYVIDAGAFKLIGPGADTSAIWGAVTGTLSSQADLQTALDGNAPSAQGGTNGNTHDHSGGDGAQIAYGGLSGLPTLGTIADNAEGDFVAHSLATAANDFLVASGVGAFVKKTLAQTVTILRTSLDSIYQAAGSYLTSANIEDAIVDAHTTIAPSNNAVFDALALKQATLVSGTNIKSINGSTVLGSGDLVVSGAAPAYTAFSKDLGTAQRSGTFDIAGLSGLTAEKVVSIVQTAEPIASKGNARDESEMDLIRATGYVVNATTIRSYWQAAGVVVGNYNFAYQVSG